MAVTLSWDLFITVLFAIVMCYSFIIGRNQSVKVIIATYIAIIATQGVGNAIARLVGDTPESLKLFGVGLDLTVLSLAKIVLFAVLLILLTIRSGIHVTYTKQPGNVMSVALTTVYGFLTAALLLSTILTYAAGSPILDTRMPASSVLAAAVADSKIMQALVLNQEIWFTLPALLLVVAGFLNNE